MSRGLTCSQIEEYTASKHLGIKLCMVSGSTDWHAVKTDLPSSFRCKHSVTLGSTIGSIYSEWCYFFLRRKKYILKFKKKKRNYAKSDLGLKEKLQGVFPEACFASGSFLASSIWFYSASSTKRDRLVSGPGTSAASTTAPHPLMSSAPVPIVSPETEATKTVSFR